MTAGRRGSSARRGLALLAVIFALPAPCLAQPSSSERSSAPELETIPVETTAEAAPAADDSVELDTIEVTASKRLKSQRDLPGSVRAIRGEELETMRAEGLKDYLKLVPGVSFHDQGSETSVPVIRGIATEIGFGFTAQTTGLYLDDMPFADLIAPLSLPDLAPFDLERIEVLKGPQGTLFGSGALAGAVRYIARKPDHGVLQGKVLGTVTEARAGGGLARATAGAINVPVAGDALAFRGVVASREDPGLYDMGARDSNGNVLRDDAAADDLDQISGRLLASWNAGERLKVAAFYFGQKTEKADVSYSSRPDERRLTFVPFASPREDEFGGGNLVVTYDFDWGRLLSSSNRMTKSNRFLQHAEWFFDLEHQNDNEWYDLTAGEVRGWTQELRLTSPEGGDSADWDWLVGAAYLRYDALLFQYEPNPGPVGAAPPPGGPEDLSDSERVSSFIFATLDSEATEQALFGEIARRFGPHWELAVGARTYETDLITDTVLSGGQIVALVQKTEDRQHFEPRSSGVNPRFSVRYLHDANVQLYALAAKGFQFGGIQLNPPAPLFVQSSEQAGFHFGPYESSTLWNYESGLRTEWLDRRLRFDLAAFYLDWKDLQLTVQVPLAGTDASIGVVANVGRAHSEGLEAAVEIVPLANARIASSAAWISALTDVDFDEDHPSGPVRAGTRLPGVPRFQWANVASYEHGLPYFTGWTVNMAVTHVYVGTSPDAIRPTDEIGGYDTVDARLTLAKSGSALVPEVTLAVNNLTDERGVTYHLRRIAASDGEAFDFHHLLPPRTALLNVAWRY